MAAPGPGVCALLFAVALGPVVAVHVHPSGHHLLGNASISSAHRSHKKTKSGSEDQEQPNRCSKFHSKCCVVKPPKSKTGNYVIGHFQIKKGIQWSNIRYFLLDLKTCNLQYNKYQNRQVPWNFVAETSVHLFNPPAPNDKREIHFHPQRGYRLSSSMGTYLEYKNPEGNIIKIKNIGVRNRYLYQDVPEEDFKIGYDTQLFPDLETLMNMFDCNHFKNLKLDPPEKVIERFTEEGWKNTGSVEATFPYPKFKKLMCLMDLEESKTNIGTITASLLQMRRMTTAINWKLAKPSELKKMYIKRYERHKNAPTTSEFNPQNLVHVDLSRSESEFNSFAKNEITDFFEKDVPTYLTGFLSVHVKAFYHNMWIAKFDKHRDIYDKEAIRMGDPATLYRGYAHDEAFLKSLQAKQGQVGNFSFSFLTGFSRDRAVAENFLHETLERDAEWNKRIFYILEPNELARPLHSSLFTTESEEIILPGVPLTVAYIQPLILDGENDILHGSRLQELCKDTNFDINDLKGQIKELKEGFEEGMNGWNDKRERHNIFVKRQKPGDLTGEVSLKPTYTKANYYLAILTVPKIDFVDFYYHPFMPLEERRFQFYKDHPTKMKYCEKSEDHPVVTPPPKDQYEEVLKFFDQKAEEKKRNKEDTDKSSAPKPPKQQDLEDAKKKAAFRPAV